MLYVSDIVLVPSLRCTRACAHCCRSSSPHTRATMREKTAEHVRRLIAEVACDGAPCVLVLSGGEPLLLSDLLWQRTRYVCEPLGQYGIDFLYIATNGDPLQDEQNLFRVARHVAELALVAGAAEVQVSLSADNFHTRCAPTIWESTLRFFAECVSSHHGVPVTTSVLSSLQYEHIIPRGRGAEISRMQATECDGVVDGMMTLTILPNGSVAACANGGPIIGHAAESLYTLMERMERFHSVVCERYGLGDGNTVSAEACRNCDGIAAKIRKEVRDVSHHYA